jgi:hypothetical protein
VGSDSADAHAVRKPFLRGWDPEARALTLLAMQRLALEAEISNPLDTTDVEYVRSRPADRLLRMAWRQRVLPLLAEAPVEYRLATWHEAARGALREQVFRCMSQAVTTRKVMSSVAATGAEPLLIKGMALSALAAGDYCTRGVGDIDILVAPAASEAAVGAVVTLGGRVRAGGPVADEAHARSHFIHATTVDMDDTSVDLHHRLDRNPKLMSADHGELFARRIQVEIGGSQVDTLGLIDATVLAASHSGRDAWPDLRSVVDFVRLARLVGAQGSSPELRERAVDQRVDTRLSLALAICRPFGAPSRGGNVENWSSLLVDRLAGMAWRRLAQGETVRMSDESLVRAYRYLFGLASSGHADAWAWSLKLKLFGEESAAGR